VRLGLLELRPSDFAFSHMHLAVVDWVIIAVYPVGCMTAGIWMRRYVRRVEDLAIAGGAMDLKLGIASLAATEPRLATVMYTARLGFNHGFVSIRT
jgi:hypothetical protein